MARKKRRAARHCSKCGSTAHDARYHAKRRRTRKNPDIGPVTAVEYYRAGEARSKGPWRHEAGDYGVVKTRSNARLNVSKDGKRVTIKGMRWTPLGLIG